MNVYNKIFSANISCAKYDSFIDSKNSSPQARLMLMHIRESRYFVSILVTKLIEGREANNFV